MTTVLKTWVGKEVTMELYATKKAPQAAGKKFIRVLRASDREWGSAGWETKRHKGFVGASNLNSSRAISPNLPGCWR